MNLYYSTLVSCKPHYNSKLNVHGAFVQLCACIYINVEDCDESPTRPIIHLLVVSKSQELLYFKRLKNELFTGSILYIAMALISMIS